MKASTTRVAEINARAVALYKDMRAALLDGPDVDRKLCEIVVTSQLALLGHEVAFKLHAMRLFESNVSKGQLQEVILAGLGVTFVIPQAAKALDWIDEAYLQHQKQA
jgi:hypothetical protein